LSPTTKYSALIAALREARELLARADNEFAWSSWADAAAALKEIDGLIARIERDDLPKRIEMDLLFAPTGDIQEVSVSSGWGQDFLRVAARYDAAAEIAFGRK
jgi:hypothetical protein